MTNEARKPRVARVELRQLIRLFWGCGCRPHRRSGCPEADQRGCREDVLPGWNWGARQRDYGNDASGIKILAIDGCPLNCIKLTLEQAGFSNFQHLQLADLGLAKGQTPASDEAITRVASAGAGKLAVA